ncbi:peptidase C14, caspase domain-containing protein, partial [Hyaloraphidium curvatum]
MDGSLPIQGQGAIPADQAAAQLGGLKQVNQRGFAEGRGKKKALFIGINYPGTEAELRGCINDVRNMYNFVKTNYGFAQQDMMVLTDDNPNPSGRPTAQNIIGAIGWLVSGAAPGDSLFMHYSGHGGTARGQGGTMQTIIPEDYKRVGQISDIQLHNYLCKKIPAGCQLTAIFDSCHSGSVLNLPWSFVAAGSREAGGTKIVEVNGQSGIGASMLSMMSQWGNNPQQLMNMMLQMQSQGYAGTCIQLSGCQDDQTSADATIGGKPTGALSWAFLTAMAQMQRPTYEQLILKIRQLLAGKFTQIPR